MRPTWALIGAGRDVANVTAPCQRPSDGRDDVG
jgi:hypothetical protein